MRYGPPARVLGTITIVFAYTAIAAYQFRGGGRLLNLVAGLDPDTGAIITAGFCVGFTALAGMSSVARLDVINGVTMLVGIGAAIVYLLGGAGGVGAAAAAVAGRSADRVRLDVAGPGAGALPADALSAARRSEHVSEVLFGARRARRARCGGRLDRRHHRGRDA